MACLHPPLTRKPRGDWLCPECAETSPAWEKNTDAFRAVPAPSDPQPPSEPCTEHTLMFQPRRTSTSNTTFTFEPVAAPPPPPAVSMRGRPLKPSQRLCFLSTAPDPEPQNSEYPCDPLTLEEALNSPQREDWLKATNAELTSLFAKGTFDIIDTPPGVRPIGCKWVFKRKYDAFGFLTKYKVRLVAKGFLQKFGLDYFDVFSPVSKMTTLRVLLSFAAANDLELKQIDVATAFLNGQLEEKVFVQIPPGLTSTYPSKCLHLRKAIYGLKQAPRVWWLNLSSTLTSHGFTPSLADTCLFYRQGKHGLVLMLVYVDDVLVAGHNDDVNEALKVITDNYECSEIEDARSFLGMAITRDRSAGTLTLSQPTYVDEVAKKHNFDTKETYKRSIPISDIKPDFKAGDPLPPDNEYASLVGSLLYLANCTRPDISFAVNTLARHLRSPCTNHMGLAKQLLRYCLSSKHLGLTYGKPLSPDPHKSLALIGYSDSDYSNFTLPEPGETLTRRSVTGFVFLANGTPVSWQSKKQVTVSRSTDEAEYQAMATTASQALWLRKLLAEIEKPARKLTIFCDNTAALSHVHNPGSINKTKHVDVQYQFTLDRHIRGDLEFQYVPSAENLADIFTKGLNRVLFERLKNKLFNLSS